VVGAPLPWGASPAGARAERTGASSCPVDAGWAPSGSTSCGLLDRRAISRQSCSDISVNHTSTALSSPNRSRASHIERRAVQPESSPASQAGTTRDFIAIP